MLKIPPSKPSLEWRLVVDRAKAALAGADVSAVGLAVQMLTNGVKVGEYDQIAPMTP